MKQELSILSGPNRKKVANLDQSHRIAECARPRRSSLSCSRPIQLRFGSAFNQRTFRLLDLFEDASVEEVCPVGQSSN